MALVGNDLYVANTDAVRALPLHARARRSITAPGDQGHRPARRPDQPPLDQEHHRQPRRHASSTSTVGSNSNVAENGMDDEEGRAAIWEIDCRAAASASSPPACAIRTAWPGSRRRGALWTVVNERDELGSDLVPDYLTSVKDGGFYGWPYSYWGQHVDERVKPPRPDLVAKAIKPDYALGTHVARSAWRSRTARAAAPSATAPSSASTAPGTASRSAATRWCSCRSRDGKPSRPAARCAHRLPQRRRQCLRPAGRRGDRQARRAAGGRRRRQRGLARDRRALNTISPCASCIPCYGSATCSAPSTSTPRCSA